MRDVIYLAVVANLGIVAALILKFGPKTDWSALLTDADSVAVQTDYVTVKKRKRKPSQLDRLFDEFVMQEPRPKRQPPSLPRLDNNRAPVHAPLVFNELMVKSAISFAQRKGHCQRKSCLQKFQQPSEQQRIYAKTLQEAHTGCSRRQLEACEIKGDILTAEGQFQLARETMDTGVYLAKSILSRCESGLETETARCNEAASRHESLVKKSKSIYNQMLKAH